MKKLFSWLKDTGVILFFAISMITVVAAISISDYWKRKAFDPPVKDRKDLAELYEAGQVNEQGV